MRNFLLSCLIVIMCWPQAANSQEVQLPTEIKGTVGAWIMVIPTKIDGGTPKWRADEALQEVRLEDLFGPELGAKAKGKVFVATRPGTFKVEAWNAKDNVPSDIATTTIVIIGPGPGPPPDPIVPPVPPVPEGPKRLLLIHQSHENGTWFHRLKVGLRESPTFKGKDNLEILDADLDLDASWGDVLKDLKLPAIIVVDTTSNKVVHKETLPEGTTPLTVTSIYQAIK